MLFLNAVTIDLEVRWGECDPAGIVYHPNYLDWFSVARMRLLADNGAPYMRHFHDNGVVLVVLTANCQFRKVLRAEDRVKVTATLVGLTRTRMAVEYMVHDEGGNLCVEGKTTHAFVDMKQRPVNVARRSPALWAVLGQFADHDGGAPQ